jgi:hypothetical protein
VEPALPPPPRDPEFDLGPAAPGGLITPPINPHLYLRIVANPFLGFAGLLGWLYLLVLVFRELRRIPELFGPLAPVVVLAFAMLLWLVPGLFHYHCLDCGRTGRLSRWREHMCARSNWRRAAGRPRRLRGPPPFVQVVLWLWGLLILGLWVKSSWRLPFPWT